MGGLGLAVNPFSSMAHRRHDEDIQLQEHPYRSAVVDVPFAKGKRVSQTFFSFSDV
jgi:hypothetical protein